MAYVFSAVHSLVQESFCSEIGWAKAMLQAFVSLEHQIILAAE